MAASLQDQQRIMRAAAEGTAPAQGLILPNQDAFSDSEHTRNDPSTFSQTMFSSGVSVPGVDMVEYTKNLMAQLQVVIKKEVGLQM